MCARSTDGDGIKALIEFNDYPVADDPVRYNALDGLRPEDCMHANSEIP